MTRTDSPPAEHDDYKPTGSGMARVSLQQAVHDLRGPLNTLCILQELLRLEPHSTDTLAKAIAAARSCATRLERLSALADTLAPTLDAIDLAVIAAAAADRFRAPPGITFTPELEPSHPVLVASCPARLALAVDELLRFAAASLHDGGTMKLRLTAGSHRGLQLSLRGTMAPLPQSAAAMSMNTPEGAAPNWFEVATRMVGIRASLRFAVASPNEVDLVVALPTPPAETTPGDPAC